VLLTALNAATK